MGFRFSNIKIKTREAKMPGIKSIFHISEMHCVVRLIHSWLHHQAVQCGGLGLGHRSVWKQRNPKGTLQGVQASQEGEGLRGKPLHINTCRWTLKKE